MISSPTATKVWLAAAAAAVVTAGGGGVATALSAFQSGPHIGSYYAGGLARDWSNQRLVLTGISYDRDGNDNGGDPTAARCFVSSMGVSQLDDDSARSSVVIGRGAVLEACHTLAMIDGTDNFVVAGNSDPGGLYGSADVPTGFVMAMDYSSFAVHVGESLDSDQVSYPVNVIADPATSALFVATLTSTSMDVSGESAMYEQEPNWLTHRKYGSSFEMTLHRIDYGQVEGSVESFVPNWTGYFPIDTKSDGTKPDVYFAGMILKAGRLIAAGSTSGMGNGYGDAEGDDEDGYLTIIDTETGTVVESDRIGTEADDIISGICHDPADTESIYIVGSTTGVMADSATDVGNGWQPFAQKRETANLWDGVTWAVQWPTSPGDDIPHVEALECLVDGDVIYVAGLAYQGSTLGGESSNGGNDVFVAQLSTEDGTVNWLKQIGTSGDDNLALGGALTLDESGNVVVFGDTTGSFYRSRASSEVASDLFVLTMDRTDGSFPEVSGDIIGVADDEDENDISDASGSGLLGGIQSGPSSGSNYAGGMVYDASTDRVFLAGATYDPQFQNGNAAASTYKSGYVATVALHDGMVNAWSTTRVFGDRSVEDSFSTLTLQGNSGLVVVGDAGIGSRLLADSLPGAITLDLNRDDLHGYSLQSVFTINTVGKYHFPVAVTSYGDDLYVVSLTSTNSDFADVQSKVDVFGTTVPFSVNRVDTEGGPPSLYMTVSRLQRAGLSLVHMWNQEFPFDQSDIIPYISIGGVIVNSNYNYLAVVGSTNGQGNGYGDSEGSDEDGFITLLDLDTGDPSSYAEASSLREGTNGDDIVTSICHDPNDSSAFYVVGGTKGFFGDEIEMSQSSQYPIPPGSLQAFMSKVDARTLSPLWTIQLGASLYGTDEATMMYALDCEVVPGSGSVYVAGTVHADAGVVQGETLLQSSGGDDLWIGLVSSSDGAFSWIEQVGSSGDDRMAPHSGLVTTSTGNAVLFGDTNGAFSRPRWSSDLRDLIVMTFDFSGGLVEALDAPTAPTAPVEAPAAAPVAQPTEPQPTPQPVAVQPTAVESQPTALTGENVTDGAGTSFWKVNADDMNTQEEKGLIIGLVFGFVLFSLLFAICYCWCTRKKRARHSLVAGKHVEKVEFVSKDGKRTSDKGRDGIFSSRYAEDPLAASLASFRDDETLGDPSLYSTRNYSDLKPNDRDLI